MRFPDWPQRLAEYVASSANAPFEWGIRDCAQFAGKGVQAMTGENPAGFWRYASELGARRFIRQAGSLEALVCEALGDSIPPAQAGRGDVVLADLEFGPTVGLCLGETCVFPASPVGIVHRPRACARLAWRIE